MGDEEGKVHYLSPRKARGAKGPAALGIQGYCHSGWVWESRDSRIGLKQWIKALDAETSVVGK
jgi:hypothetical protein